MTATALPNMYDFLLGDFPNMYAFVLNFPARILILSATVPKKQMGHAT